MKTHTILKSMGTYGASIVLCLILMTSISSAYELGTIDIFDTDGINLIKGEITALQVDSLTRVSVADPDIADIVDANDQELSIVGRAAGQTALFIWDNNGKQTIVIRVFVQDLDNLKSRIKKLFESADIHEVKLQANEKEGKVIISGEVPDRKRDLYDQIIEQFNEEIIDLAVEEKIEDLIQVDMQITELNTTLTESLGIDWTTGGRSGIAPNYAETVPSNDGHIGDFFQIGEFGRTGQLIAAVNALITQGKARILSQPKLVVISGEEATFLVGGEIPIRTTTFSDTGSSQENVEFKEFGISMTITPTIIKGKIDIVMNLEVSDIDASTATSVSEDVAFSTRSTSTRLYLEDNQTIILAGLIKNQESETVSKIPFVGDIPILGILFRSRVNPIPTLDQELVFTITPHILAQRNRADDDSDTQKMASRQNFDAKKLSYQRASPYYMGIPKEMTAYVHDVQQKISQSITYPPEARQYGWEGTVKMGMLILNDGTLAFALVKESSGHDVFDEVTLNTAKRIAPFMAFPSDTDLQELNVTIPIVYSLHNN